MKNSLENEKIESELQNKTLDLKAVKPEYLEAIYSDEKIQTMTDGKYQAHIRSAIIELLSMNVSLNKVNDVIRIVLRKSAGKMLSACHQKAFLVNF